ncbi:uncharacterized protein [Salvelinus sp. IW2-2015]|uniref:uncharacterized protein n=1 Tax=Salvelinus sp. IW2-2015 TaxID=2691554 RepID=UPI0038D4C2EA
MLSIQHYTTSCAKTHLLSIETTQPCPDPPALHQLHTLASDPTCSPHNYTPCPRPPASIRLHHRLLQTTCSHPINYHTTLPEPRRHRLHAGPNTYTTHPAQTLPSSHTTDSPALLSTYTPCSDPPALLPLQHLLRPTASPSTTPPCLRPLHPTHLPQPTLISINYTTLPQTPLLPSLQTTMLSNQNVHHPASDPPPHPHLHQLQPSPAQPRCSTPAHQLTTRQTHLRHTPHASTLNYTPCQNPLLYTNPTTTPTLLRPTCSHPHSHQLHTRSDPPAHTHHLHTTTPRAARPTCSPRFQPSPSNYTNPAQTPPSSHPISINYNTLLLNPHLLTPHLPCQLPTLLRPTSHTPNTHQPNTTLPDPPYDCLAVTPMLHSTTTTLTRPTCSTPTAPSTTQTTPLLQDRARCSHAPISHNYTPTQHCSPPSQASLTHPAQPTLTSLSIQLHTYTCSDPTTQRHHSTCNPHLTPSHQPATLLRPHLPTTTISINNTSRPTC